MDLTFLDPDILTSQSLPTPQSLESPTVPEVNLPTAPPFLQGNGTDSCLQGFDHISAEVNTQSSQDHSSPFWNIDYLLKDYVNSLPNTPNMSADLFLSASVENDPTNNIVEDEQERITMLFLKTACHNLSMQEDSDQNPWKNLIWPMAQQYPVLHHALAALAYFHTSKAQKQLHVDGERHLHTSAHLLAQGINKSETPLDVALAATLALGFAETWDSELAATGMTHIRGAGILLQQILSSPTTMARTREEEARLEFLFNTWTYMDVIARFTCLDLCPPVAESLVAATAGRLDLDTSKVDPLMGYATSFFPVMRRVADLICKVRVKNAPRNSPVIISQALELQRTIEDWVPPVDLETIANHSQLMTDAIQTAEAYRWSTLSLLYQAVPELPNLTSYGELAQKILVYLATIPLSSPTIIVHILPLIIAGNDAVEEEDRDFVRDRWRAMSKRLVTGIVERALELTEEVWKRRDDVLPRVTGDLAHEAISSDDRNYSSGTYSTAQGRLQSRKVNSFPISAAFKKGVDTITRSGCIDYTVRGNLHWLGIMKEWQWQGKLL